jgi:hypothetical protein
MLRPRAAADDDDDDDDMPKTKGKPGHAHRCDSEAVTAVNSLQICLCSWKAASGVFFVSREGTRRDAARRSLRRWSWWRGASLSWMATQETAGPMSRATEVGSRPQGEDGSRGRAELRWTAPCA